MGKAKVEFCGSHFVKKMTDKGRDRYLKHEYETDERVKAWWHKMAAIRFDKGELMEETYNDLLEEARETFNEGKRGNGKKGSLFRKCFKAWSYGKKVFINGTHSGVHELSCFDRPDDRSNQAMEASNAVKNKMMRRITRGAAVKGEHWLELSRELEKDAMDRLHQIKKHRKWKTKNPKLVAKDKAYRTVINEFKSGRIDHDEYMRKIVKLNSKKSDIPKTRRAVLRLLEDSDTE
jgi:uncharacterized membrane protein